MKIQHLTAHDAIARLRSRPEGLTAAEARRRLIEFGPNEIAAAQTESIPRRILREFTHFFALILWLAAALAFWADRHDPTQGMAALGWAIVCVILVNSSFSLSQVYGAEKTLLALERLLPRRVKVLRDGSYNESNASELVPGDVIALEAGDLVPADCRLIESFAVQVNNATVTGESSPQGRDSAPCDEIDPLHARNLVLAGTVLVAGNARAVAYATGESSEFGRIATLSRSTGDLSFPLQKEINRLSRIVAALATALGVTFFAIGAAIGLPFWANLLFAVGILVANVPEGLLPTVTLALAMGSQRMARRKVLIRHLAAVETLGSATVICTDKTGTLTENRMRVATIVIGGTAYPTDSACLRALTRSYAPFFECALLCQTLRPGAGSVYIGDPMEIALVEMGRELLPDSPTAPCVDEIPFDSQRRLLTTVHSTSHGLVLYSKGAPEVLLPICRRVHSGDGIAPMTPQWRDRLTRFQEELASCGLRVLAAAYRPLDPSEEKRRWEEDLIFTGLIGLDDPPRPETAGAITRCREAGIRVIMLTGDHPQTALSVGRQVGLITQDDPILLTGDQLHGYSESQLQLALDAPEILFARTSAEQKLRIVRSLRRKGHIVAVTGDGVNDAPALKEADIGIAMGRVGTDVAREAADMVLSDDDFASVVAAIEEGRAVFDNIRKFLTYILTSNIPEIVPYLAFVLMRIPLPLTIIQILAVDLGTDMLPALGLGAERPEADVMRRPPRARTERLLTWPLLLRAYLFLGLFEAVAAMAVYFFVLSRGGWAYGDELAPGDPLYRQATTACLAAIVLMQVANVFLCRSSTESLFSRRLARNPLIFAGIGFELVLIAAIVYHPWGHRLFGTAPLSWREWLFVLPFAGGMLVLEELRKVFVRRRAHRRDHQTKTGADSPGPARS